MNMCVSASVCSGSFSSSVCLFCPILVHLFLFDRVFFYYFSLDSCLFSMESQKGCVFRWERR